jgi:photosystem II stability/assembly factor-like uncharacterized protein
MYRTFIFSILLVASEASFAQTGWQLQNSGTSANLRSISTYDGVNAVCVGEGGTILTTDHNGVPWRQQQSPTSKDLNGVTSITARILCAVGPLDAIYRSIDRGATWADVNPKLRGECWNFASMLQISAIDYDSVTSTCVVAGDQQALAFSPDSGKHWEEKLPYGRNSTEVRDLKCVSISPKITLASGMPHLFFSGGNSIVLTSPDQGDDWSTRTTDMPGISTGNGPTFFGCSASAMILVGSEGHIFHSTNGGFSWDSIPSFVTSNLNAVSFADEINGFIVGDGGVILMTNDGGYNWTRQQSPTKANLRSVSLGNAFHGFICGDGGTILYTQDGGFSGVLSGGGVASLGIQNFPNPVSSHTMIRIYIPERGHADLRIYNPLGVEIATLSDADYDAGLQQFEWDASQVPSGIYLCRLESGGKSVVSQIVVSK